MLDDRRFFTKTEHEGAVLLAGGTCELCGEELPLDSQSDHVVAVANNGKSEAGNNQAACPRCNQAKGAKKDYQPSFEIDPASIRATGIRLPVERRLQIPAPGWAPIEGFNDRRSQVGFMKAFVETCLKKNKRHFLAEMGTGSGKTAAGVSMARYMLDLYKLETYCNVPEEARAGARLVIVITASTAVRREWKTEVEKLNRLDPTARLPISEMGSREWARAAGRAAAPRQGEVVIVSPQGMLGLPKRSALRELIARCCGSVLVIIDEVHHYSTTNSWGATIDAATQDARTICGMSGTPYRHDDGAILGLDLGEDEEICPDYRYLKAEAIADGVVARLMFDAVDCLVDDYDGDTDELLGRHLLSDPNFSLEKKLGKLLKPAAPLLCACLDEGLIQIAKMRRADRSGSVVGGAITCGTREQVEYVRRYLEARGQTVLTTYTGDGKCAEEVIESFRDGNQDWLVGIARLTEGVNIARLRVGVYVNHRMTTRQAFAQFCGRLERLILGIDPSLQTGQIIIPKIEKFMRYAEEFERAVKDAEIIRYNRPSYCMHCANTLPASATFCPYCEAEFPTTSGFFMRKFDPNRTEDAVISVCHDFTRDLIHQARTISALHVPELAARFQARCAAAGHATTAALTEEEMAFHQQIFEMQNEGHMPSVSG